jgi:hypothetical protein
MMESSKKDAGKTNEFFSALGGGSFFEKYFNFATDSFGLYASASAIAGIISSLGFLVSYYPNQVSLESGTPIAGVFCFVLFYVKHDVSKGTIHPYSVFNCYPCHQLHK